MFRDIKKINSKIKKAKSILLVCDFDGTLVGIKSTPQEVYLPQNVKQIITLLAKDKRNIFGIISGRPLSEIKKLVGINSIFYVGNHGFEIKLPKKKKFVHPQAKKATRFIKNLVKELKRELSAYKEILIEDKTYTLSVHYRNCPRSQIASLKRDVRSICLPLVKEGKIKVTEGKKVIEIRPPIDWNKGEALLWIEEKIKSPKSLTVYIGDDKTDEDAFAQVKKGLSIFVGKKKEDSCAEFYLEKPKEVINFLKLLTHN